MSSQQENGYVKEDYTIDALFQEFLKDVKTSDLERVKSNAEANRRSDDFSVGFKLQGTIRRPLYVHKFPYYDRILQFTESQGFQQINLFIVAVFSIAMGFELHYDDTDLEDIWFRMNCLFTVAFLFECICKLYCYGHNYFKVTWFVAEFISVAGGCMSLTMHYYEVSENYGKLFTGLRFMRLLLLGKLFNLREEFQVIVLGFTKSLQHLWGVFFVVFVICYGCTLFCYSIIGKHDYPAKYKSWQEEYFGSIPKIMMTLFSMIIVDEWAGFARPVFLVQPPVVFFFFIFSVMLTMGFLNVITGMVVDNVKSVGEEHDRVSKSKERKKHSRLVEKISEVLYRSDGETREVITEEEFTNHHQNSEVKTMMDTLNCPRSFKLNDLFTVLDVNGHKSITEQQFLDGITVLIEKENFHQDCQSLLCLNKMGRDMAAIRTEVRLLHHRVCQESGLPESEFALMREDVQVASDDEDAGLLNISQTFQVFLDHLKTKEFRLGVESDHRPSTVWKTDTEETAFAPANTSVVAAYTKVPHYIHNFPLHETILCIVESKLFQYAFFSAVVAYSIMMGLELEYDSESNDRIWMPLNAIFAGAFVLEMFAKLYAYGHAYFCVPWFVLEFLTAIGACVTLAMHYADMHDWDFTLRVLKISRVILLGKLFSANEKLSTIVLGFTRSLLNLWSIVFVLLVINYGCTLLAYGVVGKHDYTAYPDYDHNLYWGTIPKTMITLFSMMITDAWGGYARVVWEEQPLVILFFYLYTVMLTLGLMNVVTGIIVDTVNEVNNEQEQVTKDREARKLRKKLNSVIEFVFNDRDGHEITEEEFTSHARQAELLELLEAIDFPRYFTLKDMFGLLDVWHEKKISKRTFVDGLMNLMNGGDFHRHLCTLLGVHKGRRDALNLRKELRLLHHCVTRLLSSMGGERQQKTMNKGSEQPAPVDTVNREQEEEGLSSPSPLPLPSYTTLIPSVTADKVAQVPRSSGPWDQMRTTLQSAALHHCKEELQARWQMLQKQSTFAQNSKTTNVPALQEQYFVWNKLLSAVSREALFDLRRALEHAKSVGLDEKSRAILFTFCDFLSRDHPGARQSKQEILNAIEHGDWNHALEMIIELSIECGADKNLLMNMLTRLVTDSQILHPGSVPATASVSPPALSEQDVILDVQEKSGISNAASEGIAKSLVSVLRKLATEHAMKELDKAWQEVDSLYSTEPSKTSGFMGGFGPGYSPFSKQEEHFFIRNQISTAIRQESAHDLRRAISNLTSLGVDPNSIEIEAAYRDHLMKHQLGSGFSAKHVREALERDDWWVALDLIIGASVARGIDRHTVLSIVAKVCSSTPLPLTTSSSTTAAV